MEEDNDPFGSIVKNCIPTPSQDNALNTCGFAREAEVVLSSDSDSDPDGTPVDSTGIIMVSPPESPNNDGGSTEENFQTPTEDSLPVSPGVQRPPSAVVDVRSDPRPVAPANTPASARTVESSKGSSNLGFSEMKAGGGANRGYGNGVWQDELLRLLLSLKKGDVSSESVREKGGVSGETFQPAEANSPAKDAQGNVGTKVINLESECQMGGGLSEAVIDLDDDDDVEDEEEAGPEMGADQMTDDLPVRGNKTNLATRKCKEVPENCEEGYAKKRSESCDKVKSARVSSDNITEPSGDSQMDIDLALDKGKEVCENGDQGLVRKEPVNLDGFKQVGLCAAKGEDQMTIDLPVRENKPKLASSLCKEVPLNREESKKVCEIGDLGLARKERINFDRFKKVGLCGDGKAEAGAAKGKDQMTVDSPARENRFKLASRICKEVPLNCEEDYANKRSKSGNKVKRARLSSKPSAEDQMDTDLPRKETRKDLALDKGEKVCALGDEGLVRKEMVNLDGVKQVGFCDDEKSEAGAEKGEDQMTVDLHVKENRLKLASRLCKEVPLNCEEDFAKKRSESGDKVKRARLNSEGSAVNQMDADLPRKETGKDIAVGKAKKVCAVGDEGLVRKETVGLDGFKQVSSNDNRKDEALAENQIEVGSPRKEIQKNEALDKGKGACEMGNKGLLRKNIDDLDGFEQVNSSGNGKNETGVSQKRALPSSITGQVEISKWAVVSSRSPPKFQNVEKLLEGLKRVAEKLGEGHDDDDGIDFLEMAKRRGMTFTRPRWWPPGGFD